MGCNVSLEANNTCLDGNYAWEIPELEIEIESSENENENENGTPNADLRSPSKIAITNTMTSTNNINMNPNTNTKSKHDLGEIIETTEGFCMFYPKNTPSPRRNRGGWKGIMV